MRISTDQSDEGFELYYREYAHKSPIVKLNGEVVERCITADTDKGYIQCVKVDSNGNICHSNGVFEYADFFGVVTVELENEQK